MGDLANAHCCNAVIIAFTQDIIMKYRSKALDAAFGDKVRYYVMADDNACVRLYAAVDVGNDQEEHFCVEGAPSLYGPSDSIVDEVMAALPELSAEEVERRLAAGAEKDARESDASMRGCPGWLITENGHIESCKVCNPQLTENEACDRAAIWVRGLPKHARHQDYEDCSGCCGFDAFGRTGSVIQGEHTILRNYACRVFESDCEAQMAARSLYSERWTPCAPSNTSDGSTGEAAPEGDRP